MGLLLLLVQGAHGCDRHLRLRPHQARLGSGARGPSWLLLLLSGCRALCTRALPSINCHVLHQVKQHVVNDHAVILHACGH